jgi:hypothetical protein
MALENRDPPAWSSPSPSTSSEPQLTLYNSITKSKTPFVPLDSNRRVTWYCCGPTVYDAGHLGHARNYLTTDVLRRIMRDYFGYEVVFVQNVTDVDDKVRFTILAFGDWILPTSPFPRSSKEQGSGISLQSTRKIILRLMLKL